MSSAGFKILNFNILPLNSTVLKLYVEFNLLISPLFWLISPYFFKKRDKRSKHNAIFGSPQNVWVAALETFYANPQFLPGTSTPGNPEAGTATTSLCFSWIILRRDLIIKVRCWLMREKSVCVTEDAVTFQGWTLWWCESPPGHMNPKFCSPMSEPVLLQIDNKGTGTRSPASEEVKRTGRKASSPWWIESSGWQGTV